MKTTSLNVLNLCVPCHNRCRYCLLSWSGQCEGIADARGVAYARRLYAWMQRERPDIRFMYSFGYAMEHPDLMGAIDFMQETCSPGGEFLQFDGMNMRTDAELKTLFDALHGKGIKRIDFTFYGTKDYHDRFAGRKGDFDLMLRSVRSALAAGLKVDVGVPVTKENLHQLDELLAQLPEESIYIFLFSPHSGGRGKVLLDAKITKNDYEQLSEKCKGHFNRSRYKTPMEWLRDGVPAFTQRMLNVSLLPENIDELERQPFAETIDRLEKMDEAYYGSMPALDELIRLYAFEGDERLYSLKDMGILYRQRYRAEHGISIPDVTDERYSGSIRY